MYSYVVDLMDARILRLEREIARTRGRIHAQVRLMKEMSPSEHRHDATKAVLRCLLDSQGLA